MDATRSLTINILKIVSLFTAIGIVIPFALSLKRNMSLKIKILSFFLLPLLEVLLFVGAFIKAGSLEDIVQYFTIGDSYDRVLPLIVAMVMLFVLSSTLVFALVDNMHYKLRYLIKSITLPLISLITVLCVFILINS